ncbi:hypothetical protein ACQP2F_14335 [Actinoplanes sp. CA-030573]|uniref:hypothetical protein n=1 Tax=Actinoplanes sp. CA-030573 TaxID=3239898 RepID=UPI003D8B6BA7
MSARPIDGVPGRGTRAVLIFPRPNPEEPGHGSSKLLAVALEQFSRLGWHLVATVDPSKYMDAVRLVSQGVAART